MHSVKLVDYLQVQADKPLYNYYKVMIALSAKVAPTILQTHFAQISEDFYYGMRSKQPGYD